MLKQELTIKQQQKLSPLQIQMIKMLEYPVVEFEERIREEMEANPALEEGKDDSPEADNLGEIDGDDSLQADALSDIYDDYAMDDDIPDYRLNISNASPDDKHETIPFSVGITFHEHLEGQLKMMSADEKTRQLAQYLIGNIDEDGYLRRELDAMIDDIAFQTGISVSEEEMEKALALVQKLDPAGVGARDLRECLSLQLHQKEQVNSVAWATRIIDDYFDQFTKKQHEIIAKRMNLSEEEVRETISEIIKLNPKPGNAFANPAETLMSHVTPDFIVENNNGVLSVQLNNGNLPELRISPSYHAMVKEFVGNKENRTSANKNALLFAKQKIEAATWFIDAIKQRNTTLLQTMEAIVKAQYEFFLEGDETKLKPMKLKDISDKVNYDVSTISRVSNSKYVQTEFGIFPLKYFFSESMMTDTGEEVSNKEIKQIIQEVINAEDKRAPIADGELTELLKERGYIIARRTVAKYRDQLNIPVARLRRSIF